MKRCLVQEVEGARLVKMAWATGGGDIKKVGLAWKGPINPGEIGRFVVGQCRTQNYLEGGLENDCFCLFGEETFK